MRKTDKKILNELTQNLRNLHSRKALCLLLPVSNAFFNVDSAKKTKHNFAKYNSSYLRQFSDIAMKKL